MVTTHSSSPFSLHDAIAFHASSTPPLCQTFCDQIKRGSQPRNLSVLALDLGVQALSLTLRPPSLLAVDGSAVFQCSTSAVS